jgi:amidase
VKALHELGAAEAVDLLRRREVGAEELVRACLERIAAVDGDLGAFEHVDPAAALAAARAADPALPLAGLPVGVKDILDTADLPTECGFAGFRGRRPRRDAAAVARLRRAGGVVLGKTVTTELAFYRPGRTRNPRDPARTPGGSSSGSAAAVAARLAPAAIGSQTAGSIVRPASFCGVVGFKPSFGRVPVEGVSPFAPSLDTLGLLCREVRDVPVLMAALAGEGWGGEGEPVTVGRDPPRDAAAREPPRFALCRTDQWPRAEPATRRVLEDAAAAIAAAGGAVEEPDLGPDLAGLADAQRAIMAAEAARTLGDLRARFGDELSPVLREFLREGDAVSAEREAAARAQAERAGAAVAAAFGRWAAILTPSAIGEAPVGLESTGDPAFNRIWTLLGTPCVSLPLGRGPAGLPVGIQLVGPRGRDAALVAVAAWVERELGSSS